MKKVILVMLSVISITGFAGNLKKEARLENASQQKLLTRHFIVATTVRSAKSSAAILSKVKVIAKTEKANAFV